jgi:ATP-dependent exoDNAse (exonuclease V) beta subunit
MLENWPSFSWHKNMWIAKPETESDASMSNKSDRDYGIFVHQLLAQIRNINDIDPVIEHQEVTGNLNEQEAALFTKILTDITSHNKLSHYYSQNVWSRNETEILLKSGEIIRPDRVVKINNECIVIDYKTGNPQPEHIHQMNKYKKAIKTLGFERVKAFLVYLFDKIEIVDV